MRLRSAKGRDRIRLLLSLAKKGRLEELSCDRNEVEVLILCRGAKSAVERNRMKRRVRGALSSILHGSGGRGPEIEMGGRVILVEAKRSFLQLTGNQLREKIKSLLS